MAERVNEGITIEFIADTMRFDNSVNGMNKKIQTLGKEINATKKSLKFDPGNLQKIEKIFVGINKQIDAAKEKMKLAQAEINRITNNGTSYPIDKGLQNELQANVDALLAAEAQVEKLTAEAEKFGNIIKNIDAYRLSESFKKAGEDATKIGEALEGVGRKLAPLSAAAAGMFGGATKAAMDFESALAGVYKTVEETPTTSYKDIEMTIREMAKVLPSTTTEIAAVMEMAGQLGVKADDLEKFTKVMVDLGNATNINATEGAAAVAQFYNIMQGDLQTVDRFGAAITDLGNNSATTEADILNMAKALAATGFNIKISEQDILGLATALSSVGLKTERGGSSLSQVLKKIDIEVATNGERLENWAKVAGMSAEDFSNAWKGDTINTIKKIIKGLADTSEEGENLNVVLQDLDVKQIRQNDTMQRLANAYNRVDEYVKLANKAWAENSALSVEVNRRYATTESQMKMVKNQIIELGISLGQSILPVIKDVLNILKPIIENINFFVKANAQAISSVLGFTAVLSPALLGLGKLGKGFGDMLIGVSKLHSAVLNTTGITRTLAKVLAGAGTVGIVGAAAAAVIGILALVKAYKDATDETKNYIREQENMRGALQETQDLANQEYQTRANSIEQAGYYAGKLDTLAAAYNASNAAGADTDNILEQINTVIGILNQSLGDEVFAFDAATGQIMIYGKETDNAKKSTEELVGAMKQQAWLEAHQNAWIKAQETQQEAIGKMANATAEFGDQLGQFSQKNYGGLKIPPEIIENINSFTENGVLDFQKLSDAIALSAMESGIKVTELQAPFEDIVKLIYNDLDGAYTSWNTKLAETDATLAQAEAEISAYNAVMGAQPSEIDAVIASLGLQGTALDNNNSTLEEQITYLEMLQTRYKEQHGVISDTIQAEIDKRKEQMEVDKYQAEQKDLQIQTNKANAITAEKEIDAEKRMNSQRNTQYEQKARQENDATTRKKTENDNNYTNKVSIPNTITRGETEKRVSNEVATVEQQNSNKTKQVKETNVNAYKKTAKDAETEIANHTNTETQRAAGYIKSNITNAYSGAFGEAKRQFNQMMAEMDARQLQAKYVDIYERYHPADRSSGVAGSNFNNINTRNEWENQPKSGGFGDINLETKIYVNSNPDIRQVKAWGRQIADVINVELGRLVKA